MSTVLFSDIHGKISPLRRVFELYPDEFKVCLGDAVGVGENDEVLSLLRDARVRCVLGNHEVDIIHLYEVSAELKAWTATWPYRMVEGEALYCHTRLDNTTRRFHNIGSILEAREMFESADFKVAFVGHSHSPGWWKLEPDRPKWTHAEVGTELVLGEERYIVDVGSLGEPRRPEDARFALWDGERVRWGATNRL